MIRIFLTQIELPSPDAFTEVFLDVPRATILIAPHGERFAFLARPKSKTIPLGNHYHTGSVKEKKPEYIHVVAGSWKVLSQHVNETGSLVGDPAEYIAQSGQTVIVPPMIWHALYAETDDAALMELYDNKDDYTRDVCRLPE